MSAATIRNLRHTSARETKRAQKAERDLREVLAALRTALNHSHCDTIHDEREINWARSVMLKLDSPMKSED